MQKFYHKCDLKNSQKQFFIFNTFPDQSVLTATIVLPSFSLPQIFPKIFLFSGNDSSSPSINPRFKMILWSIIAGTRGGINRAKILNLIKETPLNAHKISTTLNLDHKTVAHHIKILAKNELVKKAEKDYGAEYQLSDLMKENQNTLEEIMEKIGTN